VAAASIAPAAAVMALSLRGVAYTYPARRKQPARQAVRDATLEVPAGQTVALLGPNGSGKSTLIRLITGMLPPTAGEVRAFGRDAEDAREFLGVVFQTPGLDRHMTVWENLRDSAALYGVRGVTALNAIEALLRDGRIEDRRDALVKSLSGGLARRVDLARALLSRPRLLVLDEPTTGLDPSARREFMDHVQRCASETNAAVLMSTHLIDEAERAQRVLMMHEGRIVADDSPAALRSRLGARRAIVHDADWDPSSTDDHWTRSGDGWLRDLANEEEARQVAQRLALEGRSFSIASPTLADAFAALTGATLHSDIVTSRVEDA
jgi:ABC-2 type transport system ATP-binding protein